MKNKKVIKYPITVNYNQGVPPIGCIELFDNFDMKNFCKDYILAPGYIQKEDGKIELLEVSLIPFKNYKPKK